MPAFKIGAGNLSSRDFPSRDKTSKIKFDVFLLKYIEDGRTFLFCWKYHGTYLIRCWVEVDGVTINVPSDKQWTCDPGRAKASDPSVTMLQIEVELASFIEYAEWGG